MRASSRGLVIGAGLSFVFNATPVDAQVDVKVRVNLPVIRFETAPPLVVVSPGVQVVPDYDEEIFFVDGWYWYRWQGAWYRRRHHQQGEWVVMAPALVPVTLVKVPPGKYKRYKYKGYKGRPVKVVEVQGPGPRWRGAPIEERRERFEDHRDRGDRGHGDDDRGRGHGKGHRK